MEPAFKYRISNKEYLSAREWGVCLPDLSPDFRLHMSGVIASRKPMSAQFTILLVEDNEMNRDMLSRRLQRHGFKILVAETGEEGIEIFDDHQQGAVLQ